MGRRSEPACPPFHWKRRGGGADALARMGHAPAGRLSYTRWALVFTGVSLLISNVGLSLIIALAVPVLYFLCPLAIVLILLGLFGNWFGHARIVYQCTMGAGLAVAVLELVRVTGGPCRPLAEWIGTWLPLYRYGLGWTVPAVCGFVLGLILRRTSGKAA